MNKLFISYRREDSADICGRLDDKLASHFGRDNVFKDVDSIPLGVDFRQVLRDAVSQCGAMLVVIGRAWLDAADATGNRRLESPNDFVRIEVEAALARNIPVIPVLVQGATIPNEDLLPDILAPLAYRHGIELRGDPHFHRDADLLVSRLAPILQPAPQQPAPQQPTAQPTVQPAAPATTPVPATTPAPAAGSPSAMPSDRFPDRLRQLGLVAYRSNGTEYILPPLCDVPAGPFTMGSDRRIDTDARDDELPQHTLSLRAFQIAKFQLTVAEYACFLRTGHPQPGDWNTQRNQLDHPIVNVSWYDVHAYADWLARLTGQPWRLPTEAEWEKAARGTDQRVYTWGGPWDKSHGQTSKGLFGAPTSIGMYPSGAGPYGAQDLAGNVWEWTNSLARSYPYDPSDGREDMSSVENRVLRGGSYFGGSSVARVSRRYPHAPTSKVVDLGFRLCFGPPTAP